MGDGTESLPQLTGSVGSNAIVSGRKILVMKMESLEGGQERMEGALAAIHEDLRGLAALLRSPAAPCACKEAGGLASQTAELEEKAALKNLELEERAAQPAARASPKARKQREVVADLGEEADVAAACPRKLTPFDSALPEETSPRPAGDTKPLAATEGNVGDLPPGDRRSSELADERGSMLAMERMDTEFEVDLELTSLPPDWPASVAVRKALAETVDGSGRRDFLAASSRSVLISKMLTKSLTMNSSVMKPTVAARSASLISKLMINPKSTTHVLYQTLLSLVLLYDLTVTPFTLAWDIPLTGTLGALTVLSCMFWTFDIVVSFLTGLQKGEDVEMRPWVVAKHYARTMFIPDLVIVTFYWLSLAMEEQAPEGNVQADGLRILRYLRLGKLFRTASLLRLTQVSSTFEDILEVRLSDIQRILLRCMCFVAATLLMNHVMACAWFTIGRMGPTDTGQRWVKRAEADGNSDILYEFVTAMHWSVAQFTLGAMDINAQNSAERIFNMVCLLIGLVFGSTLISSLSATMVDYQASMKHRNEELRKLRRFLSEGNVSQTTRVSVVQQARDRLAVQERIQERDVKVLQKISKSLYADLRCEMFTPHLESHPLFLMWHSFDIGVMRVLCTEAINYETLLPTDDLFVPGYRTDRAYHLTSGHVQYTKEPDSAPVPCTQSFDIVAGAWLAEASLWSHWTHVGSAKAVRPSQVMVLSPEGVVSALSRDMDLREVTGEYCRQFHAALSVARPPLYPWPDDMGVPGTEFCEVVMSMSSDVKGAISLYAIEHAFAERSGWVFPAARASHATVSSDSWSFTRMAGPARTRDKLTEEVNECRSCVVLAKHGYLLRVVSEVVLNATTEMDLVLAELGEVCRNGKVKAGCRLPSRVQDQRVSVEMSFETLLSELGLEGHSKDVSRDQDTFEECKQEELHGVNTKYVRRMHSLQIEEDDVKLPLVFATRQVKARVSLSMRFSIRRASARSGRSAAEAEPLQEETIKSYKVVDGDRTLIYAWLTLPFFKFLKGPAGEKELEAWIQKIHKGGVGAGQQDGQPHTVPPMLSEMSEMTTDGGESLGL